MHNLPSPRASGATSVEPTLDNQQVQLSTLAAWALATTNVKQTKKATTVLENLALHTGLSFLFILSLDIKPLQSSWPLSSCSVQSHSFFAIASSLTYGPRRPPVRSATGKYISPDLISPFGAVDPHS